MDFSKYIEWVKLSPRYLFPIAISSGILLFSGETIIETLGLAEITNSYRSIIGIIFLLSFALVVASWGLSLGNIIKNAWLRNRKFRNLKKRISDLTLEEKDVLLGYIQNQTRTQYLSIENGVVIELESLGIIYRSSNIGDIESWSYNIQPWAWKYLNEHPELLLMTENEERKALQRKRIW